MQISNDHSRGWSRKRERRQCFRLVHSAAASHSQHPVRSIVTVKVTGRSLHRSLKHEPRLHHANLYGFVSYTLPATIIYDNSDVQLPIDTDNPTFFFLIFHIFPLRFACGNILRIKVAVDTFVVYTFVSLRWNNDFRWVTNSATATREIINHYPIILFINNTMCIFNRKLLIH